jgi:phytol kinase
MDRHNFIALLASFGFLLGTLLAAELGRGLLGTSRLFGRKLVIVGIGTWSTAAVRVFTSWQWGIMPLLTMTALYYASYRYDLFQAVEDDERVNLGLVFFPLSVALLLGWLWRPGSPNDAGYIAVAGSMATTWGDTAAAVVGRHFGTRRYRFSGHPRSMEGTLALFLVASAAVAPVMAIFGGMDWHQSVAFALIAGTIAACVEIVSVYGSDNLTVPCAVALTLYALSSLS